MHRCLELAAVAEGRTSPNPMVGSVVVRDGKIIGEGYHHAAGQNHAEVNALLEAGDAEGATIYVNLEPCCHFGRTPPCSKLLIDKKIKRVVIALKDPDARVAGGGIAELRAAGVEVTTGVLEAEGRFLNRGFLKAQEESLPWLSLKMALTLDGRIADREGQSKYVTGNASRQFVMTLRDKYDCVLIGAATARLDNPRLNVRNLATDEDHGAPLKAVFDPNLTVGPAARLFEGGGKVVLFCHERLLHKQSDYPAGCTLLGVAENFDGKTQLSLRPCLQQLLDMGVHKILCEGGGRLAGSLLQEELVDELYWMVAPKMLIDESALPAVASPIFRSIKDAQEWKLTTASFVGDDLLIHGLAAHHDKYLF